MNWPALMALGLGILRLSPQAFWAMTPRELAAAAAPLAGPPPLARADLNRLMKEHPDD